MKSPKGMLTFIAWCFLLASLTLVFKFFHIQVIKSDVYQERVVEQRVKEIPQLPERGKIVDRNGSIMAMSLMTQDIAVYPNVILNEKHREKVSKVLSKNLGISYEYVYKQITKKNEQGIPDTWANIKKRVPFELARAIKESGIGGVEIRNSPKRYYPNGEIGANFLGAVNMINEPVSGIERSMNSYLSGVPGYTLAETDNDGKVIPVGFENISSPVNGQKVTLTIDSYLQYVLEKRVKQTQEEMEAKSIHAVLMNPKNGEIYAMTSTPSFNPNEYEKYEEATWTNNAWGYVYEPGSTFKPIYMAMALEEGVINKDTTFHDGVGAINVNGTWLKNWDGRALGQMTLKDIITNSSNVGMIQISKELSTKEIENGLRYAGFGKKTGIDLPGEEYGLFPTAERLKIDPLQKATVSFGQGIAITPIQLITAFSELINGGYEVNPKIVSNVEDEYGNLLYQKTENNQKQKYKSETVELIKTYLRANMEEGSGKNAQIDGYESGGKTGSAWVVEEGKYKEGVIIGSFVGFAPYDDPEFALLVVVNQPKDAEYGSTSAGPTWQDVMTEALRYKSVPKKEQKNEKVKIVGMPNVEWLLYDDAKVLIEKSKITGLNLVVEKVGNGQVVVGKEYVARGNRIYVKLKTKKIIDKHFIYMPSLKGKLRYEIEELFSETNIALKFHGQGKVIEQGMQYGRQNKQKEIIFWLGE